MDNLCDACNIVAKPSHVLFETRNWLVMLASDQGYLGRSYVTLKTHKGQLSELTQQEWKEYGVIVRRLEKACSSALNATLFNWSCLLNNAYREQSPRPHIHWHFRPRYTREQRIGATTFSDPEFGHHYDREQRAFVDQQMLHAIAEKIKAALE